MSINSNRRKVLGAGVAATIGTAMPLGSPLFAQSKKTVIRLADQAGAEVCYAAIWVAENQGFYDQEGIQIDRRTYPNGPASLLDLNKNLDAVMCGLGPIMQYAAGGGQFTMVCSVTKYNAPLVGRTQYKSYADLNGKKVGTPGLGTIHDAILFYIEKTYNLKFQKVPGRVGDIPAMLDRGEVEAFIAWEPAASSAVAKAKDAHYIVQLPPIKNSESLDLVFHPNFIKENPDAVVRFLRATLKGMNYVKTKSRDDVASIVAKKMNDPTAMPIANRALGSVLITDPRLDMPSTRLILKTISEQGKIDPALVANVDAWIGKYLDYSYLDKAEKSLKA
jgi:NitT/TauT family transport system substrate-binding protein